MICKILSFHTNYHFVGVSLSKAFTLRFGAALGIILVKKSAFNHWSYIQFQFSVTIRVHILAHTAHEAYFLINSSVSSIQSCFCQVSVLGNPYRSGIGLICGMNIHILCVGLTIVSISYAVKRIKPSAPVRIFMIRALIATE